MKGYPEIASEDTIKFSDLEYDDLFEFCCMSNPKGRELWKKISPTEAESMLSEKKIKVALDASVIKMVKTIKK